VIDYPGFLVIANGYGNRFEADRDRHAMVKTVMADPEYLQFRVWRVHRQ
jgi:hypothetical protein